MFTRTPTHVYTVKKSATKGGRLTCVDKALAKALAAAKVDLQHGVALIRQQLHNWVVTPAVPECI
jgi:hypothetical protein